MLRPTFASVFKSASRISRLFGRRIPKVDRVRLEKKESTGVDATSQEIEVNFSDEFLRQEIQNYRTQVIKEMQSEMANQSELAFRENSELSRPKEVIPEPAKTFFKKLNVFSKAQTENLIKNESIYIDGKPADLSTRIEPSSKITLKVSKSDFDDLFANTRLYMLHKPIGFVGDEFDRMNKGRRTVMDVIHQIYKNKDKLYPIVG